MTDAITSPWRDESELAMVKDWFFPSHVIKDPYTTVSDDDMRAEAVARVNIWTFKSSKVPPAVLCTADLTDSILKYEYMIQNADSNSYRAVQFMFAFAFLRFVNAFVDRDVARAATSSLAVSEDDGEDEKTGKSVSDSSMYAHAMAISMPARFVDMRHRVSHGNLPDVLSLKKAADEGLVWLSDRWWKSNATGDGLTALTRFESRKQRSSELPAKERERLGWGTTIPT